MSHSVKLTLGEDSDREAIDKLSRYRDRDGGEAAAAKRFMLRGMALPEPPLVIQADEALLRRIIREEMAAGRLGGDGHA